MLSAALRATWQLLEFCLLACLLYFAGPQLSFTDQARDTHLVVLVSCVAMAYPVWPPGQPEIDVLGFPSQDWGTIFGERLGAAIQFLF